MLITTTATSPWTKNINDIMKNMNNVIFPGFVFIYTFVMWNVDHHESPPIQSPNNTLAYSLGNVIHKLFILNLDFSFLDPF